MSRAGAAFAVWRGPCFINTGDQGLAWACPPRCSRSAALLRPRPRTARSGWQPYASTYQASATTREWSGSAWLRIMPGFQMARGGGQRRIGQDFGRKGSDYRPRPNAREICSRGLSRCQWQTPSGYFCRHSPRGIWIFAQSPFQTAGANIRRSGNRPSPKH